MLSPQAYRAAFASALHYGDYLATAKTSERPRWDAFAHNIKLTEQQLALVRSFERRINVLVISGTWCGDCVQQVPILAAIAQVHTAADAGGRTPGIDLRIVDRDAAADLSRHFTICGGGRVPVVIFLNEEFDFVALAGDRTLNRYRRMAAARLGPSCPLPGAPVPANEVAAVTGDWLDEFERVALLLRLSTKLRAFHND